VGETDGDKDSPCIGGGDAHSGCVELTDACIRKSWANCPSSENEVDERVDVGKSSYDVRRELMEVIRFIPNKLGLFRVRGGPGSLSTVEYDTDDRRLRLCMSDDDME
jgi:hypothetical protein